MSRAIFPPTAYTEGGQFQHEKQMLFANAWLLCAASGQMRQPGDIVVHGIGGWPLFAVRGGDGVARAFHNVCRHQSMPVVDQGSSHCTALRCRYHGWTYGFDGCLIEAPPRYPPPGPLSEVSLQPAVLDERDGLCFVRVTPGADQPPSLGFAGRSFAAAMTTDIDANWKAAVETLLDDGGGDFIFPLALVGDGVVRQIVPRTFSRTRLVDLVFSGDAAAHEAGQRERAAAAKTAAEACQARRAAGEPSPAAGPVGDFLAGVAAACYQ